MAQFPSIDIVAQEETRVRTLEQLGAPAPNGGHGIAALNIAYRDRDAGLRRLYRSLGAIYPR